MILDGCQGKPRTPTIEEKICPQCGHTIEIFSTDTEVACENCGFVVYNDALSTLFPYTTLFRSRKSVV